MRNGKKKKKKKQISLMIFYVENPLREKTKRPNPDQIFHYLQIIRLL